MYEPTVYNTSCIHARWYNYRMPRSEFVNRDRELREIRALSTLPGPRLVVLYGRRRIGKTFLLQHAWRQQRVFYFLAANTTAALNRIELLRDLGDWLGQPVDPTDYPSWRTIFRLFVSLARTERLIVVLDEFQYLLGGEDDAASQLAAVWDKEAVGVPLTLAVSGSEVSSMERLLSGAQPLFGRASWAGRLHPFDYFSAAEMVPARPVRERALVYGIFGGSPRYLSALGERESLAEAVIRTVLSPRGEINVQLETVIEQEGGIADTALYRAVLSAVAAGHSDVNAIAQAGGLGAHPRAVRRSLEVLENLGLVDRERNFDAYETAAFRYRISDNAIRFWHRFVHPNRGRLQMGEPTKVWSGLVQPYLDDYMGKVFERIVREAFERQHQRWGLPGPRAWSRWEGRDKNRRSIEIDIISRLDDGRLLAGEIKWSSRPVGVKVHFDLQRNLDDLGASGRAWAREALDASTHARYLYVSAAGFSDEMQRLADETPGLVLKNLGDLYVTDP